MTFDAVPVNQEYKCLYMQLGQHMWRGPMDTFGGKVRGDERMPYDEGARWVVEHGATLTLNGTPAAAANSRGYLAYNGGDGFERVWYVSAAMAARAQPMTLTIDSGAVGNSGVTLRRSSSLGGSMTRIGSCSEPVDGKYVFSFTADGWQNGFYYLTKNKGFILRIQ